MNVAYIRVSTIEQNTTRQYEDLKKFKIDKFFEEKASGKSTNRPILKEMLQFVRDGDTLYIESFSRLARNTKDLLDIIEQLKKKNVKIISEKEKLDSDTPTAVNWLNRNCSAMWRAPLPERGKAGRRASSSWRTRARSFSTRSANSRCIFRQNCCACWRAMRSRRSG